MLGRGAGGPAPPAEPLENQEVNALLVVADERQMASKPDLCVPFALSHPGTARQDSAPHVLQLAPLTYSPNPSLLRR